MSYHELEVESRYSVICLNCDFRDFVKSAGRAEDVAKEHIEQIPGNPIYGSEPHYNHNVSIMPTTIVGRNL